MRRWGEPADIGAHLRRPGDAAAFGFATGSVINADGGLLG